MFKKIKAIGALLNVNCGEKRKEKMNINLDNSKIRSSNLFKSDVYGNEEDWRSSSDTWGDAWDIHVIQFL